MLWFSRHLVTSYLFSRCLKKVTKRYLNGCTRMFKVVIIKGTIISRDVRNGANILTSLVRICRVDCGNSFCFGSKGDDLICLVITMYCKPFWPPQTKGYFKRYFRQTAEIISRHCYARWFCLENQQSGIQTGLTKD